VLDTKKTEQINIQLTIHDMLKFYGLLIKEHVQVYRAFKFYQWCSQPKILWGAKHF